MNWNRRHAQKKKGRESLNVGSRTTVEVALERKRDNGGECLRVVARRLADQHPVNLVVGAEGGKTLRQRVAHLEFSVEKTRPPSIG